MNDMVEAFFGAAPPVVKPQTMVTGYTLAFTPAQADELYNDIYAITGIVGIDNAPQRDGRFPALFALYDALHAAGIDGSGSHGGAA